MTPEALLAGSVRWIAQARRLAAEISDVRIAGSVRGRRPAAIA
ncbi:MAG: hypothetical protein ACREQM_10715 [Candidatus Dormibacteraceae bacterium]